MQFFLVLLHIFDVCVDNSSQDIHYESQNVERMELYSSECEEAEDGLYDRLGDSHHAGGQCRAHRGAHELRPGQHAAGDDQREKYGIEAGHDGGEALSYLDWFPQDHGDCEEYWQGVVAVNVEHLNDRSMVLF